MVACRLLLASAMLLLSVPARASRPHDAIALSYLPSSDTASGCPAASFLREEVEKRLGYDLFEPAATPRLTVTIDRLDSDYRVTGELRSDGGDVTLTSTFTEGECGVAVRSLAVAVAIRFTHLPSTCPLPAAPAPAPACDARAKGPANTAPRPVTLPEPTRVQMGIASAFSIGSAPVVVGGAAWFLGARRGGFSAALEGRALLASATDILGPRVRDGYHFLVAGVAASACVHPGWAFACVQLGWGSLSSSNGAVDIDPDRVTHVGFGFRFGGERALTRTIALRAYVDTLFELSPGNLRTRTAGAPVVWHKPAFSGAMGLGPVITF